MYKEKKYIFNDNNNVQSKIIIEKFYAVIIEQALQFKRCETE